MNRLEALAAQLPPLPESLLIGLSGGADSIALTRLLLCLPDHRLACVHVNHGLRGEASDGDEAFVRDFCRTYGLELLVYHPELPERCSEEEARQARWACFRQAMETTGAQALALAHHRDDQAETLLLHLLRGSGLDGLTGMRPDAAVQSIRVVRPLLDLPRQSLRDALTEANQPWREDASNQDARYLRNALRGQILPQLEALQPGAAAHLAATARRLQPDADALNRQANALLNSPTGSPLPLAPLLAAEEAVQTRVLRLWWQRETIARPERQLSDAQTQSLRALLDSPPGSSCNLPGDHRAWRGYTHLHLLPAPEGPWPGLTIARAEAHTPGDGRRCQAVPDALLRRCELRTRQPGDRITPFGSRGSMSLQDYLINRKVDAPFRDRIPLLADGSDILWVPGVGAGVVPPWQPGEPAVLLTARGPMPWCPESQATEVSHDP